MNGDSQQELESPKFFFRNGSDSWFYYTVCEPEAPAPSKLSDWCFVPFTQILHSAAAWQSKHLGIGHSSFSSLVGHSSPRPLCSFLTLTRFFLYIFCTSHTLSEFITDHLLKFLLATWSFAYVFDPERIF